MPERMQSCATAHPVMPPAALVERMRMPVFDGVKV